MGGVAGAIAMAASGIRTGRSLGAFLAGSTGPDGLAGGLEAVGLQRLVGLDRIDVLTGLLDEFAGAGGDLESQAARNALLDVLDELLPEDADTPLDAVQLDEASVADALRLYLAALIYNLAIPIIDERLTLLENPTLAQRRDAELRQYIDALVRLRLAESSPLSIDWQGPAGQDLIDGVLRAVYDQLEAGS
jgi:hypothetical protein